MNDLNRRRGKRDFDDSKTLTSSGRVINTAGTTFAPGQPIDKKKTSPEFRCRLWVSRRANYLEDHEPVAVEAEKEADTSEADVAVSETNGNTSAPVNIADAVDDIDAEKEEAPVDEQPAPKTTTKKAKAKSKA